MKIDTKTIITVMSVGAMLFFIGYILYQIELTTDIALMFFGAFIGAFSTILNYFFTRKSHDSTHNKLEEDIFK